MKNIVRAFVIALTVSGSVAYTQIDHQASPALTAHVNARPTPMCDPNGPSDCGIYGK